MNVAAVFAPKKVYGCAGFETSNCFTKLHFATTTPARARIATGSLHSTWLIGDQCHAAYVGGVGQLVLWIAAEVLVIAATDASGFHLGPLALCCRFRRGQRVR